MSPDVVWISHGCLQGALNQAEYLTCAPEPAVEVLLPGSTNICRDREVKLALYSGQGYSVTIPYHMGRCKLTQQPDEVA